MTAKYIFMALLLLPLTAKSNSDFSELELLFSQWRAFEAAPLHESAPDYRQSTFDHRRPQWKKFNEQLLALDKSNWTVPEQIDWFVMLAELNGYQFNEQVLKPWARDPAFYKQVWTYKSDVPAHEGPTPHYVTELWTYDFPLNSAEQERLITDLSRIKPLQSQARLNLTGNAKELWIAGIRDIKEQHKVLTELNAKVKETNNTQLLSVLQQATDSTAEFAQWLEAQSAAKTGPSGLGEDQYTWYQQNVHLLPLNWQDEVRLLERELDRSWSTLKLEEHRNRDLPELVSVKNAEQYDALANRSAEYFLNFLEEKEGK